MKKDASENQKVSAGVPKPSSSNESKSMLSTHGKSLSGHKGDILSGYDKSSQLGGVNPALKGLLPPVKGK